MKAVSCVNDFYFARTPKFFSSQSADNTTHWSVAMENVIMIFLKQVFQFF